MPPQFNKEIKFQKLLKDIALAGAFASLFAILYGPILVLTVPIAVLFGGFYFVISSGSNFGAYKQKKRSAANEKRQATAKINEALRINGTRGQTAFAVSYTHLTLPTKRIV